MSLLSELKGERKNTDIFYKFCNPDNWWGQGSFGTLNAWIATNGPGTQRKLMVAGPGKYLHGLGANAASPQGGFEPVDIIDIANPLEAGEKIEDFYYNGSNWFYRTNLGNLFACGYNGQGQLGVGDITNRTQFTKVTTFNKNVARFATSGGNGEYNFCMAVTTSNQLYAWGYNAYGNLGIVGNITDQTTPQLITGGSISGRTIIGLYPTCSNSSSYQSAWVVDSNRDIHVCGWNANGYFGLGPGTAGTSYNNGFVSLSGLGVKADKIIAGLYTSEGMAVVLDKNLGTVHTVGVNYQGQIGDGTTTLKDTGFHTVSLPVGRKAVDIWAGGGYPNHIGVILDDGSIRVWGSNDSGILGDGTTTARSTPIDPNTTNNPNPAGTTTGFGTTRRVIKARCAGVGAITQYVLTDDGRIYAAGENQYGQCGIGTASNTNYWNWAAHPYGLKFVDFEVWGNAATIGATAVDENGDIFTVGYNGTHAAAAPAGDGVNHQVWRQAHIRGRG